MIVRKGFFDRLGVFRVPIGAHPLGSVGARGFCIKNEQFLQRFAAPRSIRRAPSRGKDRPAIAFWDLRRSHAISVVAGQILPVRPDLVGQG